MLVNWVYFTDKTSKSNYFKVFILKKNKTRKGLFVNQTMRRLVNYNRMLDEKIYKFAVLKPLSTNRRFIFVFPEVDIEAYIARKLQDKEKLKLLKRVKSIFKTVSAMVMSITFISLMKIMRKMLAAKNKNYQLKKIKREKLKKRRRKKKRNSNITIDVL